MTNSSNKRYQKTGLKKPKYEVADVVSGFARKHQEKFGVTTSQKRILENVLHCRTMGMGGHASQCDHCEHIEISYNSCRDRHCPKCQSLYKAQWLENRRADLLPVKYLHSVFTLPHELNDLILYNKRVLLNALFTAVKHTLTLFSKDPTYGLVGQVGFTSVLHTWDQKMNLHYHLHCVLPAGVFGQGDNSWIPARYKFLFPVKAMSKVFRGKYVSMVRNAYNNGKLNLSGKVARLGDPSMFSALLSSVMAKDWVVFSKTPFKSPSFVLDYLGRYTHRVAISNNRIVKVSDQRALFTYKKRNFKGQRYSCETEICDLEGEAFIQRFLLHELPSGFMRIRHFGFMGNNCKKDKLRHIRVAIGASPSSIKPTKKRSAAQLMLDLTGIDITLCGKCKKGKLYSGPHCQDQIRQNLR